MFTNVEHLLPEAVQHLVALIGIAAVVRLVEQMGGTTFPVALRRSRLGEIRYEQLSEVVGPDAADQITKHFGGENLYIPRCVDAVREARDRKLRDDFDAITKQHSAITAVAQLAIRYKMSDRHVWRVLKQPNVISSTSAQDALF